MTTPESTPDATPAIDTDHDAGASDATPEAAAEADTAQAGKPNREARYRTQLRDTQGQLAAANERLTKLQTAELTRLAAEHLDTPGDLFALTGTTLADYLGEDGELDAEAVADAVAGLLSSRPALRKRQAAVDPSQGTGGGRPKREVSWGTLLQS